MVDLCEALNRYCDAPSLIIVDQFVPISNFGAVVRRGPMIVSVGPSDERRVLLSKLLLTASDQSHCSSVGVCQRRDAGSYRCGDWKQSIERCDVHTRE